MTEAPSTTPHCCPLTESLRLLLCCILMPSIFRASPLPSARARSGPPGGALRRLGVVLWQERGQQHSRAIKKISRDEAFLIAVNIAKLPSVPRQILKDIPRPPNSASRDD